MSKNWQRALYKIAQATRSGKIKWVKSDFDIGDFENVELIWAFETSEAKDPLRIYRFSQSTDHGETTVHDSKTKLEFIDSNDQALWTFPEHSAIDDIANAVQYQVNGIDDKLERLFEID